MNWLYSSAVRLGFGPPEWVVIAIVVSLLFVAFIENGSSGAEIDCRDAVLSRKEKRSVIAVSAVLLSLIGFVLWRSFVG